jgi:hypothetical protein
MKVSPYAGKLAEPAMLVMSASTMIVTINARRLKMKK